MAAVDVRSRVPPKLKKDLSATRSRQQQAPDAYVARTQRGALITSSLPSLQNLIKRSPDAYAEEFGVQWNRFSNLVKVVQLGLGQTKADEDELREVTAFICQTAHLYPTMTKALPATLSSLLMASAPAAASSSSSADASGGAGGSMTLLPDTRRTMVQGLVLLRRRDVLSGIECVLAAAHEFVERKDLALLTHSLLKILFPLLSLTTSPNLRTFILKTIIGDIKHANLKTKNHKLNRTVQGLLFAMIEKGLDAEAERLGTGVKASRRGDVKVVGAREALWAVKIASELWRKSVWRDSKTVSIVASACFHPDTKVQSAAMHFFLVTPDEEAQLDSDADSDDGPDIEQVKHRQEINKKRKSTERKAKRDIRSAHAKRKAKAAALNEAATNFSALQLLNDPETFGEKLYFALVKYDKSYTLEHKVLMMQLFGRVSGAHKLNVLGFYSYIVKYLHHHQLQITQILVALAQSVHDLTPPDELTPVVRKLAGEFVHSGVAAEVNAAGLNAITEICRRQPWCMDRDLLEDLVEYKSSKDKGVMNASRGLLQLYREVNPGMLKKRERGKVATMKGSDAQPVAYGHSREEASGIEGLDLLAKHLAEREEKGEEVDEEAEWANWDVESEGSDDSGGWIDVSSDGEDIEISDSDDDDEGKDQRKAKKAKLERDDSGKANGKPVEVAGLKSDDVIAFDNSDEEKDSSDDEADDDVEEEEDSDDEQEDEQEDEGSDEEDDKAETEEGNTSTAADEYEMSLNRANKVLEGTDYQQLAMTKILTPADFAKINELRTQALQEEADNGGGSAARRKLAALSAARRANTGEADNFLTESSILGVRKRQKSSYEERMAAIAEGREGRDKFRSHKHRKLDEKEHSTTNEEKKKKKNFSMVQHSSRVRKKNTASLHEKSRKLRRHIDRLKRGGRRGNKG
ncbi:Severe Depolymerization of Actin [Microbotryomycetes sp. JL201]|nr:Severe Depolymerization of Actin [Microbotryomycetes sp. JL201]